MPLPTEGTFSKFGVLIRELNWALDVIQYASSSETLEFTWSEERCRYVLKKGHEIDISVAEVEADTIVCDRRNLLSQLESEATLTPQVDVSSNLKLNFPDGFAVVVKKRLQDCPERTPGLLPDCFWINRSDLHLERYISGGSSKEIYQGEWFGQSVAIAKIRGFGRDTVEKEAGFMVNVQHPNIVEFFGCAFVENEDLEGSTAQDGNPSLTGYLVMELMPEDLRSLIDREAKSHSGAPFSFSVSVDISLQIVEAMMHLHKHHVIYRDLKSKNCLVSPRPKSSPQDPDVYTVKLIDFGTSKILDSENEETGTTNLGSRRWMAPEVWGIMPSKRAVKPWWEHVRSFGNTFLSHKQPVAKEPKGPINSYSRSADVYSFAMTCCEITTGLLPFHDVKDHVIPNKIFSEERPSFSHPAAITCPLRLQKLMTKCWAQEPRDRPQFEAIWRELWSIKHDIEVQG